MTKNLELPAGLMTVAQAAAQTGFSARRIRQLIADGTLGAVAVNGRLSLVSSREVAGLQRRRKKK